MDNSVKEKPIPSLYQKKEECCGCTACVSICPADAIIMEPDEEGFLYPKVLAEKCIRCYRCLLACGFKEKGKTKEYYNESNL